MDRLKRSLAAYQTYVTDIGELLEALIAVQPETVLDAIHAGSGEQQVINTVAFEQLYGHRSNPTNAIAPEQLIAWCNKDAAMRYPFAAAIIGFKAPAVADAGPVRNSVCEA